MTLSFKPVPRKIAITLVIVALALCIQSIAVKKLEYVVSAGGKDVPYVLFHYSNFVNVNREANLPSWYSALLLLSSGILLELIAMAVNKAGGRYIGHWRGLSFIFVYLSIDEISAIHEKFSLPLRREFETTDYLHFAWVIAGMTFVVVVGLLYAKFLWHLPSRTRNLIMLAAAMYIGAAIGLDSFGANMWYDNDGTSFTYSVWATIEEFFEMSGIILFLYTLMTILDSQMVGVNINFHQGASAMADISSSPD